MLFHMKGKFITFPFNNTCLSTKLGISFCLCICFGLTANQTTHNLKSLALFYGYVRPSRRVGGLYPYGVIISVFERALCIKGL